MQPWCREGDARVITFQNELPPGEGGGLGEAIPEDSGGDGVEATTHRGEREQVPGMEIGEDRYDDLVFALIHTLCGCFTWGG